MLFGKEIVGTYKGNQTSAQKQFLKDAEKKSQKGYVPVSQIWAQGSWSRQSFIIALLLCGVLIGIIACIYMLLVKPAGTLTVTYALEE